MSYILDALNKSEKERTRRKTPGLSSLQESESPSIGARGFFAILLVVVALNSVVIYFYFGDKTEVVEPPASVTEQTVLAEPPGEPPDIEITAHIYAPDSELRMVKIDGVSRKEGDTIGDNHRLLEITERGLVLEYAGKPYTLNVIDEWQIRR